GSTTINGERNFRYSSQLDVTIKNRHTRFSPVPVGFRLFASRMASSLRRQACKNRNKCSVLIAPFLLYWQHGRTLFFISLSENYQLLSGNLLRRRTPPLGGGEHRRIARAHLRRSQRHAHRTGRALLF